MWEKERTGASIHWERGGRSGKMVRENEPQTCHEKLNEFLICEHLPLVMHDFRGVSGHHSDNRVSVHFINLTAEIFFLTV